MLTLRQKSQFEHDGYLKLEGLLGPDQLDRLDRAIMRAFADAQTIEGAADVQYLCGNIIEDPELAFIVEHPKVIAAVEILLGGRAYLSQYDIKLRQPGYIDGEVHYDYKPYRTVGSSLNWLFVMIPLVDYSEQAGPLLVAPGSHRLAEVLQGDGRVRHVRLADSKHVGPVVDPHLRRGDVLLMHMFTWHQAKANRSDHNRYGLINKYMATDAPPAAGPHLYSDAAYAALSDAGKPLLPHHSNRRIATSRLLVDHHEQVLLVRNSGGRWSLPGGTATEVSDHGNAISSLVLAVDEQLDLTLPWASYVGDYVEDTELCRVYAYPLESVPDKPLPPSTRWFDVEQLLTEMSPDDFTCDYEQQAVNTWFRTCALRGVGWPHSGPNTRG